MGCGGIPKADNNSEKENHIVIPKVTKDINSNKQPIQKEEPINKNINEKRTENQRPEINKKNDDLNDILGMFSPDHISRHELEFQFIPNQLPVLYTKGMINDNVMTNPSSWKNIFQMSGLLDPTYLDQITVQKIEMNNGIKKFFLTFPEPKIGTECFYAILFFDENKNWNYFTLEKEFGNDFGTTKGSGLICGQVGRQHLNFNKICRVDTQEFEVVVQQLYDNIRRDY